MSDDTQRGPDWGAALPDWGAALPDWGAALPDWGAALPDWGAALEASDLGLWERNLVTGESTWNARCAAIIGYEAGELPGRSVHPGDEPEVERLWEAHLRGLTASYRAEFRLRHAFGHWVWVREQGRVYQRNPDGTPVRAGGVLEDISRQKAVEEELLLLRERCTNTVRLTTQIPWTASPDGAILSCEPVWETFTGLPIGEALNEAWVESIHPDDRRRMVDRWMHSVRTGEPYRVEHRLRRFDGEFRYAESRALAERGADGTIRLWYGSTEDIHDRVMIQRSLQESETRLELALEGAGLATWDLNLCTGEVLRSPRWFQLLGYEETSRPIPGEFWFEQVHPQDHREVREAWAAHLAGRAESYRAEFRIRHRSGMWRWMVSHGRVAERDEKGPVRACGINQDITEQRRTAEALERSERFSRLLLDASQDCLCLLNPAGRVEYINPAGRKRLAWAHSALLSGFWLDHWRADDRAALSDAMAKAFRGETSAIQAYSAPEEAAPGWWDVVFSPLSDGNGQGRRILASAREITALREREEKQRALAEKERLQAIVENLNEGILIAEPGGTVLLMNRAARHMYGFDAAGLPCEELFAMLDASNRFGKPFAHGERPLARALRGEPFEGLEAFFRNRASGREWIGSCGSSPVRTASGALLLAVLSVREITAEKKVADEILHSNEMLHALSGQLLRLQDDERRRIARELHDGTVQVLSAELMNLNLLARSPAIQELKSERELLAKTLGLARQCVTELRTMSYLLHPPALEQLGLIAALRSWIDGFSERTGIPVDVEVAAQNIRLGADAETALFRITQEALANVHRHSGASTATVRLTLQPGRVELEIRDDGKGFNPDYKSREEAPRLGVGLPGMRERARQLGGELRVRSGSEGTVIHVRLPGPEPHV